MYRHVTLPASSNIGEGFPFFLLPLAAPLVNRCGHSRASHGRMRHADITARSTPYFVVENEAHDKGTHRKGKGGVNCPRSLFSFPRLHS